MRLAGAALQRISRGGIAIADEAGCLLSMIPGVCGRFSQPNAAAPLSMQSSRRRQLNVFPVIGSENGSFSRRKSSGSIDRAWGELVHSRFQGVDAGRSRQDARILVGWLMLRKTIF